MRDLKEPELQATIKGRQLRMQQLIEFIKNKGGKATYAEICQFMMRRYWLAISTIDKYLKELETSGIIEVKSTNQFIEDPWLADPKERYVLYKGE